MTDYSGQYFGRYYLTEQLGEGGMAVVYKAYDTRLERDIAIKVIRSGAFPSDDLKEILKRFEREAKSLAKLSHPNIVKVHDYGEHEGSPYLVMEYLPGGTLKKLLGKPTPWQDAVRLILPVARGVAYAHKRGILHRDIKPANVLITDSGEPMLSDFGIAKLFEGGQTTALTESGMAIGTPEYMAPEQWTGTTSPQSDQYSLGIVLYELITGRKPYAADTPAAILIKQATEPLPSPRKFVSDLPEMVEHVLIKTLARGPGDRYQDLSAFIDALENLDVGAPVAPEPKRVEETYRIPAQKPTTPVPTQISTQVDGEKVHNADAIESQDVNQETLPPLSPMRVPSSFKFSRKVMAGFIGIIVIVLAVAVWFLRSDTPATPASTLAATSTSISSTSTSVPPSVTSSPSPEPTNTVIPTLTLTATPLPAEITDAKGAQMMLVPAGEFTMGADSKIGFQECQKKVVTALGNYCNSGFFVLGEPSHKVFLDDFYIDKYETTNVLYKICVDAGVCKLPESDKNFGGSPYYGNPEFDNYPVVFVNWNMAKTYCEWRGARLPLESEWEKAARGVDERIYPWGAGLDCAYANYWPWGTSGCVGSTTRAGKYEIGKSPYGVYDMAGNVWEWTADLFEAYPGGDAGLFSNYGDDYRVIRGGAWVSRGEIPHVMSFERSASLITETSEVLGFRCAKSVR